MREREVARSLPTAALRPSSQEATDTTNTTSRHPHHHTDSQHSQSLSVSHSFAPQRTLAQLGLGAEGPRMPTLVSFFKTLSLWLIVSIVSRKWS